MTAKKGTKAKSHKGHISKKKAKVNVVKKPSSSTIIAVIIVLAVVIASAVFFSRGAIPTKDVVVATVNGDDIMKSEFDLHWKFYTQGQSASISQEQFLDQLVEQELLIQEANKNGITLTKEEAKAEIEASLANMGGDFSVIEQQLEENGFTWDEASLLFINQITVAKLAEGLMVNLTMEEYDVRKFYNENPDLFIQENVTMSYEEIKPQLEQYLIAQQGKDIISEVVVRLREIATIETFPENLN